MKKFLVVLLYLICNVFYSCTVTNNMYVNDPTPLGKGNNTTYIAVGTGMGAKIDSTSANGNVHFSNKIETAPVLSLGQQHGLSPRFNLRWAFHLPKITGGFGGRLGAQYSLLNTDARINMAAGLDAGFVYARDKIRISSATFMLNPTTNGAFNADLFIPVSVKISGEIKLVLTPRYSTNVIYIRNNTNIPGSRSFVFNYPVITIGMYFKTLYFESSLLSYNNLFFPNFGVAFTGFDTKK